MKCIYCKKDLRENFGGECSECNMPLTKDKKEAVEIIRQRYNGRMKATGLVTLVLVVLAAIFAKGLPQIPPGSIILYSGYALYLWYTREDKIEKINNLLKS